mmetsp:Transcript_6644/g.10081  ORF Transcript_6644/g.10081 Transcript_6644/m.10081 type:complete len:541 (+) Transcript_6644:80-1702(+)
MGKSKKRKNEKNNKNSRKRARENSHWSQFEYPTGNAREQEEMERRCDPFFSRICGSPSAAPISLHDQMCPPPPPFPYQNLQKDHPPPHSPNTRPPPRPPAPSSIHNTTLPRPTPRPPQAMMRPPAARRAMSSSIAIRKKQISRFPKNEPPRNVHTLRAAGIFRPTPPIRPKPLHSDAPTPGASAASCASPTFTPAPSAAGAQHDDKAIGQNTYNFVKIADLAQRTNTYVDVLAYVNSVGTVRRKLISRVEMKIVDDSAETTFTILGERATSAAKDYSTETILAIKNLRVGQNLIANHVTSFTSFASFPKALKNLGPQANILGQCWASGVARRKNAGTTKEAIEQVSPPCRPVAPLPNHRSSTRAEKNGSDANETDTHVLARAGTSSAASPRRYIGDRVRCYFGKDPHDGVVTAYDPDNGWYRVVYDDGDVEDNTLGELKGILALHALEGLPTDNRSNEDAPKGEGGNKATELQENDTDEEEELQFLVSKSAETLQAERFEKAQAQHTIIDLADSNRKSLALMTEAQDAQDAHEIIDLCDD